MRAFIAITLPEDLRKEISKLQSELRKENVFSGNWTSSYHITLKFLGEIDEEKLEKIKNILENICTKTKKFTIELNGVSGFPSENYIRVLFIDVGKGNEPAMLMQRQIDAGLKKYFEMEKNYANHITLIRVKSVSNKQKLKEIIEAYKNKSFGTMAINKLSLIKSTLAPGGPVYETIKEFQLA